MRIDKLTLKEKADVSKVALRIFDDWKARPKELTPRQLFVLAFLKGRECTLDEMGMFDEDDIEKTYEYLLKYGS